ncbi:helix-turn-helix domain-containing protein, partial [Listeria monocytogenes]|nr:helix-turn-helix domain-containing protein [Listeria monocytogenes]EAE4772491.1 helix-turn-helix domain-containing protein [Listeria monocytogenes]EAG8958959.1 helix-turn-helix domain-containing protein [Listeria monocytogenes]ECC1385638.1 helix-turn-helix domain-containing protein [Listeria monocytogenes]ECR2342164.1 helix-turn-helix domain-containing protein [Listeria monocytogenes]
NKLEEEILFLNEAINLLESP